MAYVAILYIIWSNSAVCGNNRWCQFSTWPFTDSPIKLLSLFIKQSRTLDISLLLCSVIRLRAVINRSNQLFTAEFSSVLIVTKWVLMSKSSQVMLARWDTRRCRASVLWLATWIWNSKKYHRLMIAKSCYVWTFSPQNGYHSFFILSDLCCSNVSVELSLYISGLFWWTSCSEATLSNKLQKRIW